MSSNFERVKEIIAAVRDLSREEREQFIERECSGDDELRQEVESLLEQDDHVPDLVKTGGALEETLVTPQSDTTDPPPANEYPDRIGPYSILGVLGTGGMGTVFRAEQQNPRRLVALKVIRRGSYVDQDDVRLFQREIRALAHLKHPSIASIYESGRTNEGEQYFAMELVDGKLLHHHVKALRDTDEPSIVDLRAELRLFRKICLGVQYAHQRGVIHRDLKPQNIKIDESGDVKILDFGLARITNTDMESTAVASNTGSIRGTIPYMSPEQTSGNPDEIDLRSDVYSLGVVLYEMLSGELPYDVGTGSLVSAIRTVCEQEPAPLRRGRLARIDPDIETIARKALEKDPERRYASASALADDIERFLNDQPILARPPSGLYQFRKLVSRHRGVSVLAATLFLALVVFGGVMTGLFRRSEANLDRALEAESESSHVSEFLIGLFQVSEPGEALGNSITAREILDRGARRIETELEDEPAVQAKLMATMGEVYLGLGLYGEAEPLIDRSLRSEIELNGPDARAVARNYQLMGVAKEGFGSYEEAEENYRRALAIEQNAPDAEPSAVVNATLNLSNLQWIKGEYAAAESLAQIALEATEPNSPEHVDCLANLGNIMIALGRFEEAEEALESVITLQEFTLPENHPDMANALTNLSAVYLQQGRFDDALPVLKRMVPIQEQVLGANHPEFARLLVNLGTTYMRMEDYESAEPFFIRARKVQEAVYGGAHDEIARTINQIGSLYRRQGGREEEAITEFDRAATMWAEVLGERNYWVSVALNNLAEMRVIQSNLSEAERLFRQAIDIRLESLGPDNPAVALPVHNLAEVYRLQARHSEAEPLYKQALKIRSASLGNHVRVAETLEAYAIFCREVGREDEAIDMESRAAEVRSAL